MRPVIALLSDFGSKDHYVGTMKAVILGICPDVTIVDITHEIAPHDVLDGALELAAAYRFFPAGTIFLAVVDPGVGSARRGIAAEVGDYRFISPDNGLLTAVIRDGPPRRDQLDPFHRASTWGDARPAYSTGPSPFPSSKTAMREASAAGGTLPTMDQSLPSHLPTP
jgi:hypothetical protein